MSTTQQKPGNEVTVPIPRGVKSVIQNGKIVGAVAAQVTPEQYYKQTGQKPPKPPKPFTQPKP